MFQFSNVPMFNCANVQMSNIEYKKSNVNKVKLLSERTSGVPLVIFKHEYLDGFEKQQVHLFASLPILPSLHSLTKYDHGQLFQHSSCIFTISIWHHLIDLGELLKTPSPVTHISVTICVLLNLGKIGCYMLSRSCGSKAVTSQPMLHATCFPPNRPLPLHPPPFSLFQPHSTALHVTAPLLHCNAMRILSSLAGKHWF